ncbi:MAG: hypothetical protein Q8P32_04475 [Candidatus Komeilibacteria bacterium]|nr:hypothetical protein [Candidatus Komeilibacteria bacterium]
MIEFIEQQSRHFANLVIGILIAAALIFLLFGDYLRLSGFLLTIVLIILPNYLAANWLIFKNNFSPRFIALTQFVAACAGYLNFLGSLDFYRNPATWWYDLVLHFVNPLMIFIITAGFVVIYQDRFFHKTSLFYTVGVNFVLAVFLSFSWEFYEFLIDLIFSHSTMFGQHGEVYFDTLTDLAADLAAAVLATWLIYTRFYGYILNNTVNYRKKVLGQ